MTDNKENILKLTDELFFLEVWDIFCLSKKTEKVFDQFQKNFLEDFIEETRYINFRDKDNNKDKTKEVEDKEEDKIDDKYIKIYRNIIKLTHPDKDTENKYKDLFLLTTMARETNQWQMIVLIANSLNIPFHTLNFSEREGIRNFGNLYSRRIKQMKESHEWLWNTKSNDKQKLIKKHLYEKLNIDSELFNEWRNSNGNKK